MEQEIQSLKEENVVLSYRVDELESEISSKSGISITYSDPPEDDEDNHIEDDDEEKRLVEEKRRNDETIVKLRRERDEKYIDVSKSDEDAVIVSESTCEIDDNVFFNRMFTSLTIPSSVKKIGSKFCFHCTMLRTVKFLGSCPEGLEQAFDECWRLKEIIVPEAELEKFKASLLPEYHKLCITE
ncbi:MAG: leucine-rich repeat domain-containing protein [Bacteroidales bacterium]|nr:leucine-rich repeat domain-containing protein [Bacteroidales bacterium]